MVFAEYSDSVFKTSKISNSFHRSAGQVYLLKTAISTPFFWVDLTSSYVILRLLRSVYQRQFVYSGYTAVANLILHLFSFKI
jgi:hypothetical protein